MKSRPDHYNENQGVLYVVSTPIGNLEDITLRALSTLKSVNLIVAENVQHSKKLCQHYGINNRFASYNQHNSETKGPEIIEKIKSGYDIALITSAGTPTISDPGALLISMAIGHDIKVSPVPGASAVISALCVSGLHTDGFVFVGFLSNRPGKRKRELKKLSSEPRTMVFYEAPHRIKAMLGDLIEILGDRRIVILRELTKVYEEAIRGTATKVLAELTDEKTKGEFTLVVEGNKRDENAQQLDIKTVNQIEKLLMEGRMTTKEISGQLAEQNGVPYRLIYKECIRIKKKIQKDKFS